MIIWAWGIGTLVLATLLIVVGVKPLLRWIWRFCTKWVIGLVLLFLLNRYGQAYGWYVPVNPVTTGIAGILGIPGTIALVYLYDRSSY
ncbi:pro-sigmaK processing inhibitor BofA family protein [Jeotgalibacillus soli]|uniref:Pro-sigmaK processing inhibitor BofA n=1 Tax=Jeotgalibacillus soli TaxID=889306 RepID=A0A0C2VUQ9_9BACL|nr:pro-sigmaK processing inhibitor BofA family protein [Jeotgalibacillus soli]KIL52647.1 pro-sigmaK processing inhibitor BofA [Jeotgalibacillus soli]